MLDLGLVPGVWFAFRDRIARTAWGAEYHFNRIYLDEFFVLSHGIRESWIKYPTENLLFVETLMVEISGVFYCMAARDD